MKKILLFIIIMAVIFQGCSRQTGDGPTRDEIRIAEQYGIAYAPLQIMRHKNILEEKVPGAEIVWEQMINTAAIREAMIADELDVGFMAIPPFYIGWDKGMEWKIFTGLSSVPVGLVAQKDIKNLQDLTTEHRIALPQPGSVQHILLSMALNREFGEPQKLDNQLVTLSHPDGLNALINGNEVQAHFTATPYLETELNNEQYHQILSSQEAFGGDFSFIVGVTTNSFHDKNPELYQSLKEAVTESIKFINEHPEEAAGILKEYYDLSQEDILEYITQENTNYSSVVRGTKGFSDFMMKTGYITRDYQDIKEIMWEDAEYEE